MKKVFIFFFIVIFLVIILISHVLQVSASAGYKTYQQRTLVSILKTNTDLNDNEIEYLLTLPTDPYIETYTEGIVGSTTKKINSAKIIEGNWLFQDDAGATVILFNGTQGVVLYNAKK